MVRGAPESDWSLEPHPVLPPLPLRAHLVHVGEVACRWAGRTCPPLPSSNEPARAAGAGSSPGPCPRLSRCRGRPPWACGSPTAARACWRGREEGGGRKLGVKLGVAHPSHAQTNLRFAAERRSGKAHPLSVPPLPCPNDPAVRRRAQVRRVGREDAARRALPVVRAHERQVGELGAAEEGRDGRVPGGGVGGGERDGGWEPQKKKEATGAYEE